MRLDKAPPKACLASLLGTIPNGIDTPEWSGSSLHINTNPRGGQFAFDPAQFGLPALGSLGNARTVSLLVGNTAFYFRGFEADCGLTWNDEEREIPSVDDGTFT